MGHSRSTLVDAVYFTHPAIRDGERGGARDVPALCEQPKLRVIAGNAPDVKRSLDESPPEGSENRDLSDSIGNTVFRYELPGGLKESAKHL
jgi:hypothetical protein